jgi:hypothetical protein
MDIEMSARLKAALRMGVVVLSSAYVLARI